MTDVLRRIILDAIEAGMTTYKGLGRDTGVSRPSIMRFATGRRSIRLDMADKLAAYFGLSLRTKAEGGEPPGGPVLWVNHVTGERVMTVSISAADRAGPACSPEDRRIRGTMTVTPSTEADAQSAAPKKKTAKKTRKAGE